MENTDYKPSVLYVDDEEDNLFVFKSAFRRDYNIFTALSGLEGLEIVKKEKISVIITDQRMPHMTGTQFLQELPDDTMTIRMIMTGYSDIEAVIDAINTGKVYKYITKPWDKDELKVTIDNALEAFGLRRKNIQLIEDLRDANENLEQKVIARTAEVIRQKGELEQKNKEITDSIHYARTIQDAILPFADRISQSLKDFFILYQPKAIVSGDFYWFAEVDGKQIITAADCTGHGVPGAFMSMIGNDLLNDIVNVRGIVRSDLILNELHKGIRYALKQEQTYNHDGMDIALAVIDKKNKKIHYSGAKNPLVYVRNNELFVMKADKLYIGGSQEKAEQERIFRLNEIELSSRIMMYLFTDGYADQFGGPKGKKFKYKQLEEVLLANSNKSLAEQKTILEKTFDDWKGDLEQVDDVLVIGIRI